MSPDAVLWLLGCNALALGLGSLYGYLYLAFACAHRGLDPELCARLEAWEHRLRAAEGHREALIGRRLDEILTTEVRA